MSSARWQHLDLRKAPARAGDAAYSLEAIQTRESRDADQDPAPPDRVREALDTADAIRARAYFQLGQWQACADLLAGCLHEGPPWPGALRLLGLCLGCLGDAAGAAAALQRAVVEEPLDAGLRASLTSAQLEAGLVPTAGLGPHSGPEGELAGAAAWVLGQRALGEGQPRAAAAHFSEAAALFLRHSSPALLGERLTACYVGAAISHLLAGQLEAAEQAYTRIAGSGPAPRAALAFARQVYELAATLRDLPADDRAAVLQPLGVLLCRARLRVRFYDQVRPVAMHWENLP